MISEPDETRPRDRSRLVTALLASALVNLAAWALAIWTAGLQFHVPLTLKEEPREYVITSSSLRIEHRVVPQPHHPMTPPHPTAVAQNAPAPRRAATRTPERSRPTQRNEIARTVAAATPEPDRTIRSRGTPSLSQQLAQQQVAFEREAQALHAQNAPVSIATVAPQPPSTFRRTYMDLSGRDAREHVETVLQPLPGKHWFTSGMSCYYVHYDAQFSGGGTETGNIPWPVCYPADRDAMLPLDRPHELPIPFPPLGYVLPSGTPIGPFLDSIYTHTIH